jgi:hypothetical protein
MRNETKKLSVIIAVIFLFALMGCERNTKTNIPASSFDAKNTAHLIANHVVSSGDKDPDCGYGERCNKVVLRDKSESGDASVDIKLKVSYTKTKHVLTVKTYALVNVADEEKKDKKAKVEFFGNLVDKKLDGSVDYMKGVWVKDGETVLEIQYKGGKVKVTGKEEEFAKEKVTSELIQKYYEKNLAELVKILKL